MSSQDTGQWIDVRIAALHCADSDGSRPTPITAPEIESMVDLANAVFVKAKIRLLFDPDSDLIPIRDTVLNSLGSSSDPNRVYGAASSVDEELRASRKVAERYPGRLVVIFRYGGSKHGPSGGGYSGSDQNCVVMPALRHTNAGKRIFAHEFGHFCYLGHTFGPQLRTREAAEQFLKDGNDLSKFDGDGLSDTPLDPGVDIPMNSGITKLILNGYEVPIATGNIMSYMNWEGHETLSDQQAASARKHLLMRLRIGLVQPTNQQHPGFTLEAEDMEWKLENGAWGYRQPMDVFGRTRWSNEAQVAGGGPKGNSISFKFTTPETSGMLVAYVTKAPMYGFVRFELDGKTIGNEFDCYEPGVVPSGPVPLGKVLLTAGTHILRIQATGKHPEASSDNYGLDCIRIKA